MRRIYNGLWIVAVMMVAGGALPAQADPPRGAYAEANVTVHVDNVWARATTGPTGAIYMTITNRDEEEEAVVTGLSTPVAEAVELHMTVQEQRFMRMVKMEDLALAPGQSVEMKPGGMHVMLIGLEAPLEAGKGFPLTIEVEGADALTVPVSIKALNEE